VGTHYPTYTRKYIFIILANDMTDIASDASQLFMFTPNHDLDKDMWDNVGSEIAHLSRLILILARGYPLNVLCGFGYWAPRIARTHLHPEAHQLNVIHALPVALIQWNASIQIPFGSGQARRKPNQSDFDRARKKCSQQPDIFLPACS
jgi:hypothetical protein